MGDIYRSRMPSTKSPSPSEYHMLISAFTVPLVAGSRMRRHLRRSWQVWSSASASYNASIASLTARAFPPASTCIVSIVLFRRFPQMHSPVRVSFGLRSYATDSESGSWPGSDLSSLPSVSDDDSLCGEFHCESDLTGFDGGSIDSATTPKTNDRRSSAPHKDGGAHSTLQRKLERNRRARSSPRTGETPCEGGGRTDSTTSNTSQQKYQPSPQQNEMTPGKGIALTNRQLHEACHPKGRPATPTRVRTGDQSLLLNDARTEDALIRGWS